MRLGKALPPLVCLALAGLLVARRGQRPPALVEAERVPVAEPEPEAVSPEPTAALPPPSGEDVRQALERVFGGVVHPDRAPAAFDAADFNGDGAQDLAVLVVPLAEHLPEINHALANWQIDDLGHPPRPAPAPPDVPAQVAAGELLLAMIHGFGPAGWRSHEARQAYLLRRAPHDRLEPLSPAQAESRCGDVPYLRGDVLASASCRRTGFVYWTSARYALWQGR